MIFLIALSALSLLEPALIRYVPNSQKYIQEHMPIIRMYEKGDKAQAIDSFLSLVGGARCHNLVDKILPGATYQAIADADRLFKIDNACDAIMEDYTRRDKNSLL
ncbi:MAG: hypothetical protein ACTHKP_00360 [Nitrososphaeraceae archaeon]